VMPLAATKVSSTLASPRMDQRRSYHLSSPIFYSMVQTAGRTVMSHST
jgi:hypothetical protein